MIEQLEVHYPEYYKLKFSNKHEKLSELVLDKRYALVQFFTTDTSIYRFYKAGGKLSFIKITAGKDFNDKIISYTKMIPSYDQKKAYDFNSTGADIYDTLFQQINFSKHISSLNIVPDGQFEMLPFGLLNSGTAKNPKFLIEDYSIKYDLIKTIFNRRRLPSHGTNDSRVILGIAGSYNFNEFDEDDETTNRSLRDLLVPLKWNETEVKNITNIFPGSLIVDKHLERDFKKYLTDFNVLHLAVHALIDMDQPFNSRLVFTQEEDSIEDNSLYSYEIYQMSLINKFIVLSACNTGIGKFQEGEGIMSFARAFLHAGAASTVVSHWQVDDQSTSQLMQYFYKNLKKGMTKSEALRQAKLTFLETAPPEKQHPFYWGAFVVIGDDSPLFRKSFTWVLPLTLLFFLVLAFISGELKRIKLAYS